jgi:hypothetical protein
MSFVTSPTRTEPVLRRQFSVGRMLGLLTLCAVVFAIPRQPMIGTILFFTYVAATSWGLSAAEKLAARMAHDAVLGFAVGFIVSAVWLFLLVQTAGSNEQVARATLRLLTGPVIGSVCGATLANLRHRS